MSHGQLVDAGIAAVLAGGFLFVSPDWAQAVRVTAFAILMGAWFGLRWLRLANGGARVHVYAPRTREALAPGMSFRKVAERMCSELKESGVSLDGNLTKLHDTPTHKSILKSLAEFATGLHRDQYAGYNGIGTTVMIGAKGVGKTTCSRMFAECASDWFNNVITVYCDFYGVRKNRTHLLAYTDLATAIMARALPLWYGWQAWFWTVDAHTLVSALVRANKRMLIIVDELDELYRHPPTDALGGTLADLQNFGNTRAGRVSVVLCGSSAQLPMLISKNSTNREEFPMLSDAPNINGTKYTPTRVPSQTPVDVHLVHAVHPDISSEEAYRVLFFSGGNIREISKVLKRDVGTLCNVTNSRMGGNITNTPHLRDLLNGVLDSLWDKNKVHMCPADATPEERDAFAGQGRWTEMFKPLHMDEVSKIWKRLQDNGAVPAKQKEFLHDYIMHLADRGWIVLADDDKFVYPSSMISLYRRRWDKQGVPHKRRIVKGVMTSLSSSAGKAGASALGAL